MRNSKREEENEKKRLWLSLLASVVVGIAITLISGLVQTPMAQLGVDVVYWGIPLP
jgi:Tfp pilus assembly protein PilN